MILIYTLILLTSCIAKGNHLDYSFMVAEDDELIRIRESALIQMRNYLVISNTLDYSELEIKEVDNILLEYYNDIYCAFIINTTDYLPYVQEIVRKFNTLNMQTNYSIIETIERELLCDYIIKTTIRFGFLKDYSDITFAWREW